MTGNCIVCAGADVALFLDLGRTALANKFPTPEEADRNNEPLYPLRVGFCRGCGHVQLIDPVDPPAMFDDYLYVSSASETLKNHLHDLARTITERRRLGSDDLVVDIGCNDGTLLEGFGVAGPARRIGIDPAANLAPLAREKGVDVVTAYFAPATAAALRDRFGRAAVITMTNTFPHIPDLAGFMAALDAVLADDGVFVLEAHYLADLLDMMAFDTVYHEHVSYWALGPMQRLFEDHGFEIFDVERLPIHHGQIRVWAARRGREPVLPSVASTLAAERQRGMDREETYHAFAAKIGNLKADLATKIAEIRAAGGRVAGYGAPAKGSTLLSYFGFGPDDLDYIVDRNTLKQGRLTPGTHIPIVAPERLLDDQPDKVVLLAWNFAEEIKAQQAEYVRRGGRFIVPVPEVREV